jgi:hypothetical protein
MGRFGRSGRRFVQPGIHVPAHDGKGVDGKNTDYIATAAWVRAVIAKLPDHPRLGA